MFMMFFLTVIFIIVVSAEEQVPLNHTNNLIPKDSENLGKEGSLDGQMNIDDLFRIWEENVEREKEEKVENTEQKKSIEPVTTGEPDLSGELMKIGEQNRSDILVELGSLKSSPDGLVDIGKIKSPNQINERRQFTGKDQIGRQEQFGGTPLLAENATYVRRRNYRGRGQFQGQNSGIKLLGDQVHFQGQYYPRRLVKMKRQNCSGELVYRRRQNLTDEPITTGRQWRKRIGGEQKYPRPQRFAEENCLGRPDEIGGQNRSNERIKIGEKNGTVNNLTGQMLKTDGEKSGGLQHPNKSFRLSEQIRPVPLSFTERKLPGEIFETGGPKPHSELVQSTEQNRPGHLVRFGDLKSTTESLPFSEQKHSGERVEIGPAKTHNELVQSTEQNLPGHLVRFGGLKSTAEPLPFSVKKTSGERIKFGVPEPRGKPVQPRGQTRPSELVRSGGLKPSDELLSFSGHKILGQSPGKPVRPNGQTPPRELVRFGGLKPRDEFSSFNGQKGSEERVKNGVPQPLGKPVQPNGQTHPPEYVRFGRLKSSDESLSFSGQKRSKERVEIGKSAQPMAQTLPREFVKLGGLKPSGESISFSGQKRKIGRPEPPGKLLQTNMQKPLGKPVQSEVQMPSGQPLRYRQVDLNRLISPAELFYLRKLAMLLERSGLLREPIFSGEGQVGSLKLPQRPNNFGNEYRRGGPIQNGGLFRRYDPQRKMKLNLNELSMNNRLGDKVQIGNQSPVKHLLFDEAPYIKQKKIIIQDQVGKKNQIFNEIKQNELYPWRDIKRQGKFDAQSEYVKNTQAVRLRNYDEHYQIDGQRQDRVGRKSAKKHVVIIIPVPKGNGEKMKDYDNIMQFLGQVFPQVFQT